MQAGKTFEVMSRRFSETSFCRARCVMIAMAVLFGASAHAEPWRDFSFPSYGFSIRFPERPAVRNAPFLLPGGASVPARVYELERDGIDYKVIVADFSRGGWTEDAVLSRAVESLSAQGEIAFNVRHRIWSVFGRQLKLVNKDGSHASVALFYRRKRLYEVIGTVLASNPDLQSADIIRFHQSLDFVDGNPSLARFGPNFLLPPNYGHASSAAIEPLVR